MKKFDEPPPVKLVCGMLYADSQWVHKAVADLETEFGEIDYRSDPLPFNYTDYYFREMGEPLFREFIAFQKLIDPAQLAVTKALTNSLEDNYAFSEGGKRVINLDPGYLNATAFILATSKNYAHRIYLGKGVFAQQELLFEKKKVRTLDWTYPDYRSFEYQEVFRKIREIYMEQLKTLASVQV